MKYLSATETEEKLSEIIEEVKRGEIIIVTDDKTGEPIAKIVPYSVPTDRHPNNFSSDLRLNSYPIITFPIHPSC